MIYFWLKKDKLKYTPFNSGKISFRKHKKTPHFERTTRGIPDDSAALQQAVKTPTVGSTFIWL
ncbi:hypothetical protein, partial [Thiolapillus sp.]|uniref:hypothetical protein n=1 Tax=Thiolapillus sp. TaxID=2017437 RepID=UPI003AF83DB9